MPRFEENVAAAVEKLGVDKAGIVFGIGMMPWSSDADRDYFLDLITRKE